MVVFEGCLFSLNSIQWIDKHPQASTSIHKHPTAESDRKQSNILAPNLKFKFAQIRKLFIEWLSRFELGRKSFQVSLQVSSRLFLRILNLSIAGAHQFWSPKFGQQKSFWVRRNVCRRFEYKRRNSKPEIQMHRQGVLRFKRKCNFSPVCNKKASKLF